MAFPTIWQELSGGGSINTTGCDLLAQGGTLLAYNNNKIYSSTTGTVWTLRYTGTGTGSGRAMCWSSNLNQFAAAINNQIVTSPDGITWTAQATGLPYNLYNLVWLPALGLFIGNGYHATTGNGIIATSPDGITWTVRRDVVGGTGSVQWSASLGKAISLATDSAFTKSVILSSTNGTAWTETDHSTVYYFTDLAWSAPLSLFVALTQDFATFSVSTIVTSPDGITWTQRAVLP